MGSLENPSVDKKNPSKMFDIAKLNRIQNREIMRKEAEQKLMASKKTCLPVIESDFLRSKDSNCNKCNEKKETYGITYEWHLEPIDMLDDTKGLYGFGKHDSTKRLLSKITNGILLQPAKIKIMKYLQENSSDIPMIYVLKSTDYELDEILLNFILKANNLNIAISTAGIEKTAIENHLRENQSLILFIDDEKQLSNVLKVIDYGLLKEVFLMPISLNYEVRHSKQFKAPLLSILPKMCYENYGLVKVNFSEPYTCSELLKCLQEHEKMEEYMNEIIESHLLHDVVFSRPVFATNIVAFILLTYFRTVGATIEEIAGRIDEIRNSTASIDISFEGDSVDVAKYAVNKLKSNIIINENLIIKPIEMPAILNELWSYAETLNCHFALQSVLILSAEHFKRIDNFVDYNKLMELAMDFCEIIQFEIPVYRACTNIKDQLNNAFDILSRKDLLTKSVVTYTENEKHAQRIAQYFDEDSDEYDDETDDSINETDPANEVVINVEMQKEIDCLKDVVLPIQESYMNVAYCLKRFIGSQVIDRRYFLDLSMSAMIDECLAGNCKYWESCSSKWIKNSLKLFEMWGVIAKIESSHERYMINGDYDNENELHIVAKHIEQFSDY